LPMPELAPVTIATLLMGMLLFTWFRL
jgi:hypothetical protein